MDPILGYTQEEIIEHVAEMVGNESDTFKTWLGVRAPFAQFSIWRARDWSWSQNTSTINLLTTQTVYPRPTSAHRIIGIYDSTNGRWLERKVIDELIQLDPTRAVEGSQPKYFAEYGNQIWFYPKLTTAVTVQVLTKNVPGAFTATTDYPTIPFCGQETLIQALYVAGLKREGKVEQQAEQQIFAVMLMQDIEEDAGREGDEALEMKFANEVLESTGKGY